MLGELLSCIPFSRTWPSEELSLSDESDDEEYNLVSSMGTLAVLLWNADVNNLDNLCVLLELCLLSDDVGDDGSD